MSDIDRSKLEGDMIPQGKYKPARELKELHEDTDLDVRGVLINTGVLVALCAVTFWAITLVMDYFVREEKVMDQQRLSLRFSGDAPPPPPVLQADPAAETREVVEAAGDRLESYGWVDREKKKAHIPIERAIAILAEKGLPERGEMDKFHPALGSTTPVKVGEPAKTEAAPEPAPEPKP